MPATRDDITTIEQLLALPEDGMRHELFEGVHVVTPSPRGAHQDALSAIFECFIRQLDRDVPLRVLWSPADIRLGENTLVQPDLFVVPMPASDQVIWEALPRPALVIEVLSESTASRDRGIKREIYLDAGIPEYWIVDLDSRQAERWRAGDEHPEVLHESATWRHAATGSRVTVDLEPLFARVLGQ